ncbi:outer membrane protein assembly factor BamB family protein [Rhodopirellula sp. P2]|uniref:outer membrane protein assembly factor BamB family protein n=1 Tax=Rhodopirellula sp. P2 TaxID=2127060 RepID=UPI0023683A2B|nr:PQQ-binding-like beta-propeller repeat protein [Rhodopirellula sp. P2]WDQ18971.1 PQQ-binding-like beta-propeller repeat protein [Rhodopirellula sp. P2]
MIHCFQDTASAKKVPAMIRVGCCLAVLLSGCVLPAAFAEDVVSPVWPTARGNFAGTGARSTGLAEELVLQWETKTAEAIESAPVSDGNHVFVVDVMGGLEAISLSTGKSMWRHELETGFVASPALFLPLDVRPSVGAVNVLDASELAANTSPLQPEGLRSWAENLSPVLVSGDVEGNVVAWDPVSGEQLWKSLTGGEISASPSFYVLRRPDSAGEIELQPRVLVTSQDGSLYCFALDSGELIWKYETGDQIRCGATIGDGKTYLGGCDGGLHVVDLSTGKASREPIPLGGPTGSTPAIQGGQLFVPIMDGVLYAFSPQNDSDAPVEPTWEYSDPDRSQEYRGSVAVTDEVVVVTSRNKTVDAIERETGKLRWRVTLKRRADASPVIAGDDVWIASTDGRLVRLALLDGREKWDFEIRGAFIGEPAIVGGRLVIADDEGMVRSFGPK